MSKAEAVLWGGHPPYPEDIRKSVLTHQGGGQVISHQLLNKKARVLYAELLSFLDCI